MSTIKDDIKALHSGEPGTTGREPFEDGTARNPNAEFSSTGTAEGTGIKGGPGLHHQGEHSQGAAAGVASGAVVHGSGEGHHSREGHHSGHGLGEGRHTGTGLTGEGHHAGSGHGHEGHHTGSGVGGNHSGSGLTGAGLSGAGLTGAGHGEKHNVTGNSGLSHNDGRDYDNDRVGKLDQEAHKYERSGPGGPTTHGAPNTDKFDTDRSHGAGIGNTREGAPGDVTERAHDKGTGGVGGLLTTTDKEFTGRDRTGSHLGAYGDETGHFKGNTSGPAGNTALTGREGTLENNPVHREKTQAGQNVNDVHGAQNPGIGSTAHPEQKEKGVIEKVKDALHM